MQQPRYIIVDTTAGAADWVQANQYLSFKGEIIGRYIKMDSAYSRNVAPVTEQLQQDTYTTVGAVNDVTYGLTISQLINLTTGEYYTMYYEITTPATGVISPTSISAQFIAAINADTRMKVTAVAVAATFRIDADAGYAQFQSYPVVLGGGLTKAATTAGIRAVGDAADLNRLGLAGLFTGTSYRKLYLTATKDTAPVSTQITQQPYEYVFFINQAAVNRAALETRITEWLNGFAAGGVVADPEIVSQI